MTNVFPGSNSSALGKATDCFKSMPWLPVTAITLFQSLAVMDKYIKRWRILCREIVDEPFK